MEQGISSFDANDLQFREAPVLRSQVRFVHESPGKARNIGRNRAQPTALPVVAVALVRSER